MLQATASCFNHCASFKPSRNFQDTETHFSKSIFAGLPISFHSPLCRPDLQIHLLPDLTPRPIWCGMAEVYAKRKRSVRYFTKALSTKGIMSQTSFTCVLLKNTVCLASVPNEKGARHARVHHLPAPLMSSLLKQTRHLNRTRLLN